MSASAKGKYQIFVNVLPFQKWALCSVSLHGCVICSHAHIEHKVTLKECVVGTKFTVTREGIMIYYTPSVHFSPHFSLQLI